MAISEILVGIACVVAQGGTDAQAVKEKLATNERILVEYIADGGFCDAKDPAKALRQYLANHPDELPPQIILTGCGSCMTTSRGVP